ncbi:MAG: class I SAM-dependent methyltransferase [Gammaproteobacteria bacterium]|nr:class I SAM-dependent methyltransferase [Gammaproteobacteria bacterium]
MTNVKARPADADREYKAAVRRAWAKGDYAAFANELIWEVGPVVVAAAGVRPGLRVLDVAAGTGNAAIRAAQAGAEVVASDLTPEHFAAGRQLARRHGVTLEWVEADAEALPFEDGEFDVVISCLGAIFAPNHRLVASELLRVCKRGGTIAMANFTPQGVAADFFAVFAPYMPPPRPGDESPMLWGREDHVRALLAPGLEWLELAPRWYVERAPSPAAYCELIKRTFGPVVAIYEDLADQPGATAALDEAFLEFAVRSNCGPVGGPAEYRYDYVLVVGKK